MSPDEKNSSRLGAAVAELLARSGKGYALDRDVPDRLLLHVLRVRGAWLARGLLRFRTRLFVGPGVRVRGKRRIVIGRNSTLEREAEIDGYAHDGVRIGERVRIGAHSRISCTSHLSRLGQGFEIGDDSGLGNFCDVGAAGGVRIGANVIMGSFVTFHSQEHRFEDPDRLIRQQGTTEAGIVVEDDCWIGAKVTFLDGSRVARGSVVAAGSVVRGAFPPFSIIAGVPAKVVGTRGERDG